MRQFCRLNITFSASKPITNLNCVFISYAPQRLCYYNANYTKNIVLFGKCLREWLPQHLLNSKYLKFSRNVTISRLRKSAEMHSLHVNTDVFNTVHRKRHRFVAFFECIVSKTYRNEYRMNKNGHTGSDINAC